jgi:hypothetical protein
VALAVAVGVAVPVANAIQAANNAPDQQLNQQQISNVVSNALVALSITAPVSISVPFVVAGLSFRTLYVVSIIKIQFFQSGSSG